ncbi:MAG: hypothetical protein EPO35_00165 [Acidobacteria bacterium]|nr:MAG: hypothetical protein EPO35_00165 [Acidobacteriota bacterium]
MPSVSRFSRLSICVTLALVAALAGRANLGARQRGQGPGTPPPPDPVPTAVSSIVANPAAYTGKVVSVTASVERMVTPTAFIVDQNRTAAQGEILVIAPALYKTPSADAYITVVGELVSFDPAEIAKRLPAYKLDVPDDVVTKFRGKPAILATALVASDFKDLTKRPPGPMTPDDEKLSAIMKQVSPASAALRTAAGASDAAAVKARAAELKKLFTDAQAVFKARSVMTALIWSSDAIKQADAADAAATAGNWADVTAATTSLTATCTSCHNAHRERQDDGTYRLKIGG